MLITCRHFGNKLISVINKINKANTQTTQLNVLSKNVYINKLICKRYFCLSSKDTSSLDEDTVKLDYELITNGDKELEHKLKVLELELDVMRQEGLRVPLPSSIPADRWKELLSLSSRTARLKLYHFLFTREKAKENDKKKKLERMKQREEEEKEILPKDLPIEEFAHVYRLGYNHMFLRFYEATINNFYNNKLVQAIRFGDKLVIDCGYENYMTKRETVNCAKQIMLLFADNRVNDDPFDLHLCNINKEGELMKTLHKFIPTIYETWFPLNTHETSYLDVFPKDQLIYLTPHCNEVMHHYDPDAVYIVGGIVDKSNHDPLSMAKAKKEGIKMAKLPLDKYLDWGLGGKSLTVNQMMNILLEIKNTGDWIKALQHVPRRKLVKEHSFQNIENKSNRLRYDRPMNQSRSVSESLRFSPKPTYKREWKNKNMLLRDVISDKLF